jgi:hypothetical protein
VLRRASSWRTTAKYRARFPFRFAPGDAEDSIAGDEEFAIALAIALEGHLDGVVAAAVGLDHEPLIGPEEVDQGQQLRLERLRIVASSRSAAGRHSSRSRRRQGAPRRFGPSARTASIAATSRGFRTAAISSVSRSPFSP